MRGPNNQRLKLLYFKVFHTCHIPISRRRANCRGNFTPEFLIVGLIVGVNKKFHAGFSNSRFKGWGNFTPKFRKKYIIIENQLKSELSRTFEKNRHEND